MRWKLGGCGLVLVAALALGVGGAGGQPLTSGTLVVQVLGSGHVKASGGQIDCGLGSKVCYFTTSTSASVTLTADTLGFASWAGSDDCSTVTTATCTFTLNPGDQDEEIANFTPAATVTLTVNATGDADNNGGNVSGGQIDCDTGSDLDCTWDVYTGSTVTLLEDPDNGFDFSGWGGACSGVAVSCTVSMTSAQTVNAAFVASPTTRTLSVTVTGNGTVTGGGIACTSAGGSGCTASEATGSQVTLTATAGPGAGFTGWGGACAGSSTTCTVTMTSNTSVTAAFSGAGGGGQATFPLSVSVSGQGTVSGGGLNCGVEGSVCSQSETAGSTVMLTATPTPGETFTSWGGACSGTTSTCSVTMSSAKTVTASFSGGSSGEVDLSVSVTGRGTVTGAGIKCGNGASTCSAKEKQDSTVGLTAAPAARARFIQWGGACSGTVVTCTVEMDAAKRVSATFTAAPGSQGTGAALLRSRGRPIVRRTATGYTVTLRFRTNRRGTVHLRALRAGRVEAALAFTAPSGSAAIGPFPLMKPGFYVLDLTQGGRELHWGACLGRCGKAAGRIAGPFTFTRGTPAVVDAGALWSVTLHFRSTQAAGADLRIYRSRRLVREARFISRPGAQTVGPLLLSPGNYALRLTATDAYGRVRELMWVALLP